MEKVKYQVRVMEMVGYNHYESYEYGTYEDYDIAQEVKTILIIGGQNAYIEYIED